MKDWFYISAIILLIGFLIVRSCEYEKRLENKQTSLERVASFKAERDSFWSKVDRRATDSVIIDRREVSEEAIKQAVDSELGEVEQFIEAQIGSGVSDIKAAYDSDNDTIHDQNCIPVDTVQKYFVRVPEKASFKDEWLTIESTVLRDSLRFDSISMRNRIDATLSVNERIFREDERRLKLNSYSPYSTIDHVNNIEVRRERSKVGNILTSRGAFFVYGVAGGLALENIR